MKLKGDYELHVLGAFVHGALSSLHLLGIIYNYRKGNQKDTVIHTSALAYDAYSVYKHYRAMSRLEKIMGWSNINLK